MQRIREKIVTGQVVTMTICEACKKLYENATPIERKYLSVDNVNNEECEFCDLSTWETKRCNS